MILVYLYLFTYEVAIMLSTLVVRDIRIHGYDTETSVEHNQILEGHQV